MNMISRILRSMLNFENHTTIRTGGDFFFLEMYSVNQYPNVIKILRLVIYVQQWADYVICPNAAHFYIFLSTYILDTYYAVGSTLFYYISWLSTSGNNPGWVGVVVNARVCCLGLCNPEERPRIHEYNIPIIMRSWQPPPFHFFLRNSAGFCGSQHLLWKLASNVKLLCISMSSTNSRRFCFALSANSLVFIDRSSDARSRRCK